MFTQLLQLVLIVGGVALPALSLVAKPIVANAPAGQFEGDNLGTVNRFLGIPYAAAPVGNLRWKAPVSPPPATRAIGAHNFKSPCMQIGGIFGSADPNTFGHVIGSEDCLYLNVWAPANSKHRPVLLFVHGGAGVAGTGSLNLYDGTNFAAKANAVYVTINYRLGIFGGYRLPALADGNSLDDSGDYSLLDIIQALKWVQKNIVAFGGDGTNITLAGQSSGCVDIHSLFESPVAAGIFQKAVCMSGIEGHNTRDDATRDATGLVANLLLADGLISKYKDAAAYIKKVGNTTIQTYLHGKRSAQILTAANTPIPDWLGGTMKLPIDTQIIDGTVIPMPAKGKSTPPIVNVVPSILSTVKDESGLLVYFRLTAKNFTTEQFWAYDQKNDPKLPSSVLMPSFPNQALYHAVTSVADPTLQIVVDRLADKMAATNPSVYRSEFDWKSYPSPWVGLLGAFHGLDVCFNLDSFSQNQPNLFNFVTPSPSRQALSDKMLASLRGFMETGNPNTYLGQYRLYWPAWSQGRNRYFWR